MPQRTHAIPTAVKTPAPGFGAPTRPWAAPDSDRAATAGGGAGHDLSRIAISAPAPASFADAPIQRTRWRWNAATGWGTVGAGSSSSSAVPPSHTGTTDGVEYEDTYSQATDPTVQPHLHGGASYMGQDGMEAQLKGSAPSAESIRETAEHAPDRLGGAGLHEIIPTNMRGEVASWGNEAHIGLQSGMRTSTDHQVFSPSATGTGNVAGHTGMFRNAALTGSTHTSGQAAAHDVAREAARATKTEKDGGVVRNHLMLESLRATATGRDVLANHGHLAGARPNLNSIPAIGPVPASSSALDPGLLALAQRLHDEREAAKTLERSVSRHQDPTRTRQRSPSPPRTRIDASGNGGVHVTTGRMAWPIVPVPTFAGSGAYQYANQGAYVTAPLRHGFDLSTVPRASASSSTAAAASAPTAASPAALSFLSPPAASAMGSTPSAPSVAASSAPSALPVAAAPPAAARGRTRTRAATSAPAARNASQSPAAKRGRKKK